MKNFFLSLFFSLIIFPVYAQQPPIMVCNAAGTTCTPYTTLDAAVTAASAGSYIYLSGWSYSLSVRINKELHLVGTGHYPDSTLVTGRSIINTSVIMDTGSSNSSLEGLYLQDILTKNGLPLDTIRNVKITRCNFNYIGFADYYFSSNHYVYCDNCLIKDCVARAEIRPGCINCTIQNSVLGNINMMYTTQVDNCIVYGSISPSCAGCISNSVFKNNIFDSTVTGSVSCSGCEFYNNLTIYGSIGISGTTIELGTITSVPVSNLFTTGVTRGFDYTKDFHLKNTCPGHNAGTDGKDVGIYGGVLPYIDGAVPSNPHFFHKNISGTTDAAGNLPVQFKVRATH